LAKKAKLRKSRIPKVDSSIKKRLLIFLVSSFVILIILNLRISYLQFAPTVAGRNLSDEARRQQRETITIMPRRGNLLDRNGMGLAFSVEVDTISVTPSRLLASNGEEITKEEVAHVFSDIFDLYYEEVLEKLHTDEISVRVVERAEQARVTELREWIIENRVARNNYHARYYKTLSS